MSDALNHFAARVAADPLFLASRIAAYQTRTGCTDAELCRLLSASGQAIDAELLTRLRLCGAPVSGVEVRMIAERFGLRADVLTEIVG